ncbi:E3 ubiquitin-protein ligase rfwd3.L-like isoform X2 [Euwallacea fornicatus]|uniref:E3 ubiquitin-protein ligase rfwd3.L-like isoform X2 n=1 Tax=Euwallacea fornicatus TaxID=995702 RepID=UPI00338F9A1C
MDDIMDTEALNEHREDLENVDNHVSQAQHSQGTSKSPVPLEDEDDDGSICPVCLEAWTNCGDHRICALKCGHLFGYKCILRWLESQSQKNCPTCKKPGKKSDIRFIYAKKLIAVDNTEMENMREQLESAIMQKNTALQNISKYISKECVLQAEIEQLKKKVQEFTLGSRPTDLRMTLQSPLNRIRLYMEKSVEVCNKSNCRDCRVFDICVPQDLIVIAAKPPTDLFGGFGIKELSLTSYRPIKFAPLHKSPIRDMKMNREGTKIMTVSSDKTVKVIDSHTTQTICSMTLESPAWACSWSPRAGTELSVGTQNGTVNIFDIRYLSQPLDSLNIPGDFSPVVSIVGVQEAHKPFILLTAKLSSVWAFEFYPDGKSSRHLLPLEGPFLSLKYHSEIKQILVSSRPSSQIGFARHTVGYLEKIDNPDRITCNVVHTFKGGNTAKLLANTSCFMSNNMVAGHHETRKSILLYSLNTGEEVGSCPTHDNVVLDLKGVDTLHGKFLAYLNENKMEFFRFNGV